MKVLIFFPIFLVSCSAFIPDALKTVEEIANNDAITIKCDKDCFHKDTDVIISVEVKNKDAR